MHVICTDISREIHAADVLYRYLILDRCLYSNPTQVVCPSVICRRSIRGAPWDSSWSLGAEMFLTFCTWRTHGPSNWQRAADERRAKKEKYGLEGDSTEREARRTAIVKHELRLMHHKNNSSINATCLGFTYFSMYCVMAHL